jgi:hypothetical protein
MIEIPEETAAGARAVGDTVAFDEEEVDTPR